MTGICVCCLVLVLMTGLLRWFLSQCHGNMKVMHCTSLTAKVNFSLVNHADIDCAVHVLTLHPVYIESY